MTVKSILDSKGTDVANIEPSADLGPLSSCWRRIALAHWSLQGSDQRMRASSRNEPLYANSPTPTAAPQRWNRSRTRYERAI
jgi:hypothetical protein